MKHVLVTGGTGFIGSHTCLKLLEEGIFVTIVDSFKNSSSKCLDRIKKILYKKNKNLVNFIRLEEGDIRDFLFLKNIFLKAKNEKIPFEAVIHFAGLKSVEESYNKPLIYWENNVFGSINLFKVMDYFDCNIIVFSSSATVYGISKSPLSEDLALNPNNPYGHTKAAVESILEGLFKSSQNKWRIASLRYFNPIGAHESALLGEDPLNKPDNLFPLICRVAQGKYEKLSVYGNDWPTNDGTGIRDYIHVMDLADAHFLALNYLIKNHPQKISLNIGTGKGISVLELIKIFNKVNHCSIPYEICKRREGDVPILVANNQKVLSTLDWHPKKTIEEMCLDGWRWQKLNPNGYL